MKKVFIIINGASCVGKSSVIEELGKLETGMFHLSYDRIKWCFLDYKSGSHGDEIYNMLTALTKECIKKEISIVKDGGLYKEKLLPIINLVKENGYKIVEINLEAPMDILMTRFKERVEYAKNSKAKVSNLSEERFLELLEMYKAVKDPSFITYDTSVMISEDIAKEIIKLC